MYLSLSWQWADANLDSSQKMVAGGAYTVRAFDMSALTGDSGLQETAEWRHDLPAWQGQWQAVTFLDSEHLTINKSVWTTGPNTATLTGVGVGLSWTGPHQWSAKASIASRRCAVGSRLPEVSDQLGLYQR